MPEPLEIQMPIADRNSELQQLSINALNSMFPPTSFLFREELKTDVGVDGYLEVKSSGIYTNARSQVQLKATETLIPNQDGSFSVVVSVSSLNYILEGPSPLLFLFDARSGEFRYLWAHDERRRLNLINPAWIEQGTVSIRFQTLLLGAGLDEIRHRILQEARFHAEIDALLSTATNAGDWVGAIDSETREITDSKDAERILYDSGRLLVTSGNSGRVHTLFKLLNDAAERNPQHLLTKAYADYSDGNYRSAHLNLSLAALKQDELAEDDRQFLNYLRKSCEYLLGTISFDDFSDFLAKNEARLTGHFAKSLEINRLKYALLGEKDIFARPDLMQEFTQLIESILNDENTSAHFKLYAKTIWLEMEGIEIPNGLFRDISSDAIRVEGGAVSQASSILDTYQVRQLGWVSNYNRTLRETESFGNRPLIASLKMGHALNSYLYLSNMFFLGRILKGTLKDSITITFDAYAQDVLRKGIALCNEAISIYRELRNVEGELHAKMLQADLYEFVGEKDKAKEIASEVLPVAETLGYELRAEAARDHLAERGLRSRVENAPRPQTPFEMALRRSEMTDAELKLYSSQMVKIAGLPEGREEVMFREYLCGRLVANEKLGWCQHLEVYQDLSHTKLPETTYLVDPNRVGACKKFGFQSMIQNPDPTIVVEAFKRTYCTDCSERKPLTNN